MLIFLGYRVKSKNAADFRKWATERLKEYVIKGFRMDYEEEITDLIHCYQLNQSFLDIIHTN